MAKGGKQKRTGADEEENRPGLGRPPRLPLSEEEEKKKEDKNRRDREYRARKTFQLKEYEDFLEEPGIADMFKAFRERRKQEFKEEVKQLEEVLMNDETNEDIEMLTGSLVAGMGTPSEPPTRGLKRKREEELAEARRSKIPATADNYILPHIPIGGFRPSGLMTNTPQTAFQSTLPGHSSRKVAQQNEKPKWINLPAQKQHDTYVPKCPSSHGPDQTQLPQLDVPSCTTAVMPGIGSQVDPVSVGFHCRKRPPHESCYTEVVISKMLDQIRSEMQERLQRMEDNIKAQIQRSFVAALTQFGSCLQVNAPIVSPTEPHHDPLYMQGGTNAAAGSSGGPTTQSFSNNEEFQLEENQGFCEEPGISTDMFKACREKNEQEFKEELRKLDEALMMDGTNMLSMYVDNFHNLSDSEPEMWTGHFAGYFEEELQSSTTWTTPLSAGAMNSTATGVSPVEPHHDPLAVHGGTTAAVGSSGGSTTQSSLHNEKV